MAYFQAPSDSEVTPNTIPAGKEVIEIVTDGIIYFRSEIGEMRLGCGAVFWHIAGDETIHRTEAARPYKCLAIVFVAATHAERSAPRLSGILDRQLTRKLCQEFVRSYNVKTADRRVLGNYIRARILWETHLESIKEPAPAQTPAIEAALNLLEADFGKPCLEVKDLAQAAEVSEARFHALFRTQTGQTPHQFLNARRLKEAQWQLSATNRTIKDISLHCGFLNIETFYRAFKKHVGCTPHDFRLRSGRTGIDGL